MSTVPEVTIDAALAGFLDAQQARLSPRTFRNYQQVVELLGHCLNGYGYLGLGEADRKRWEDAYNAGERSDPTPGAQPTPQPET